MSERADGRQQPTTAGEGRRDGVPPRRPEPDDRDRVDEASQESFPASDPPPLGGPRTD